MDKKKKMVPKGERKVHELIGKVNGKVKGKDYHSKETIYRLNIDGNETLKTLTVYQRKVKEQIWEDIVNSNCLGKRYNLFCEKITTAYHLRDWREIK